jgi:hypothetical protein
MRALLRAPWTAVAAVGLAGCGGGGADAPAPAPVPPPAAIYDIVFDHELADGSRALRRAAAEGGSVQAVPGAINAVRPHARADGLALVFTTHSVDPTAVPTIMLQPAPAATPVALSTVPGVYEREAVFSPDGRRVAFVSQRDEPEGADIFVGTLNGTRLENLRNLTPRRPGVPAGLDVTPAWSPDGTQVQSGRWRLRAVGDGCRRRQPAPAHERPVDADRRRLSLVVAGWTHARVPATQR